MSLGNIKVKVSKDYIEIIQIQAEMEKIKIRVGGMKATNDQRHILNHSMAYVDDDFEACASAMNFLSGKLQQVHDRITKKDHVCQCHDCVHDEAYQRDATTAKECGTCADGQNYQKRESIAPVVSLVKEGTEAGEVCNRNGCKSVLLNFLEDVSCSCHINPPCQKCTNDYPYCIECGWNADGDEANT